MPIFIRNPELDKALDRLAKTQPVRTTRTGMVLAILERAVEACEHDSEAWKTIGTAALPSKGAQRKNVADASVRASTPSSSPSKGDSSVRRPRGGRRGASSAQAA